MGAPQPVGTPSHLSEVGRRRRPEEDRVRTVPCHYGIGGGGSSAYTEPEAGWSLHRQSVLTERRCE